MLEIRPATTHEELAVLARIVSSVSPDDPTSVDEIKWSDVAYPGGRRFLAFLDGVAVGAGGAGRVYMHPPDFDALWGNISVLPEHRRKGVGSAILTALSEVARAAGKTTLMGRTTADRPHSIEFLKHRGFHEFERMKVVRLELGGLSAPAVAPPEGIVISSLGERPELVAGVYEVAKEALPDIPGEGPEPPPSFEEFLKRDVDRAASIPPGAFAIAMEQATGRVIGYANLMLVPGNPSLAWHGMTAVARDWRGRGVAAALKRATIAWAVANGLQALETANDTVNEPMRAVNKRLGYQPLPDDLGFRGPLWPPQVSK